MTIRSSFAFHDIDPLSKTDSKFNIFFQTINGKDGRKKLAKIKLT